MAKSDRNKELAALFLGLVTVVSVAALISGAAFLNSLLPGGLPAGNIVAACILCAPAGAAVLLSPPRTPVSYFSIAALVAAVAWLPVSIALAGNLLLNFAGPNGDIWQVQTVCSTLAAYLALAWAAIRRLVAWRR
ncbi:MAG: hypothetical protein KJO54_05005 [Gammaproteobacteria bacterium]|nr:hypothetical protein [Gammaproteobacteria bacterium]NNM21187.1 hypothetical protein [Gammaproteobacteria bacterium]